MNNKSSFHQSGDWDEYAGMVTASFMAKLMTYDLCPENMACQRIQRDANIYTRSKPELSTYTAYFMYVSENQGVTSTHRNPTQRSV